MALDLSALACAGDSLSGWVHETVARLGGWKQIGGTLMATAFRQVVFGLGSNLGDRVGSVLSGAAALERLLGGPASLSPLYETVPVGGPPQDDFINAALLIETDAPARTLLDTALSIEQRHGRIRLERYGPRTLDIDLLWIEAEIVSEPGLEVPHPRLLERAFALRPLLDVAPRAVNPNTGELYAVPMALLSLHGLRLLSRSRPVAAATPVDMEAASRATGRVW